jgi:hypothetical protein
MYIVFIRSVSLVALYVQLYLLVWYVLSRSFPSFSCPTPTICGKFGATSITGTATATLSIQSISARQQDLAETRRCYHGDMMVLQGHHARLVAEREQSMKLVEVYSSIPDTEKMPASLAEVETLGKDIKHMRGGMNATLDNQNNKRAARDEKELQLLYNDM